ncbi:uncharacterized protein N7477_006640 [Penicillium maclennaniae]|uniref:uncharacterized protein n=1 Tax=Penicillium maclennaniae TaxID=1343394 RepID=UPI002541ED6D|nr:uncharacterized protein N7477_006640 [Penicillium maclennaniae]KAJ5668070.1 hypothetical protein N7477_006640 [Penicillium maclennaniae]
MIIIDTLIRSEHKLIFGLDNVHSDLCIGEFHVTLETPYFNDHAADLAIAHLMYTISALTSRRISHRLVSLPNDNGTVFILASGNGDEEFWYTVRSASVELLIDENLAGISWPYPILFTGGVDPGLWRLIASNDAYELPSFEVDITPSLALLCNGHVHTFGLKVVEFESSAEEHVGTVGDNWYLCLYGLTKTENILLEVALKIMSQSRRSHFLLNSQR